MISNLYIYIYIYIWLIEIRDFRGSYLFMLFLIIPQENSFCWPKLSQTFTICVVRGQFASTPDDANCENLWKLGPTKTVFRGIMKISINKYIYVHIYIYIYRYMCLCDICISDYGLAHPLVVSILYIYPFIWILLQSNNFVPNAFFTLYVSCLRI